MVVDFGRGGGYQSSSASQSWAGAYTPTLAPVSGDAAVCAVRRRRILKMVAAFGGAWGIASSHAVRAQSVTSSVLTLASTTSIEHSGLVAHLAPRFQQATGLALRVVAVGTGQALDIARRGDADAVLVHDELAEARFVAEGFGIDRRMVMRNDFVLIGPRSDPAGVAGGDILQAMVRLSRAGALVVSRGDRSGTHLAEQRYWTEAGVRPPGGAYRECGCGMGAALNMAAASGAYVLSDRASWLAFRNRADLTILVQGDARLGNPYHVIRVNPQRHPHVNAAAALQLVNWLTGPAGQAAIASFTIDGQRPFEPVAAR